jgi:hypothetical protein
MAHSALRPLKRQYAHVQNAPAQELARELRGATGAPPGPEPMQPTLVPRSPRGNAQSLLMGFAFEGRCCCFDLRGKPLKVLKELGGGNICQRYPAANYVPYLCRFAPAGPFNPRVCEGDDDVAMYKSNADDLARKDFFFV